VEIRRGTNKSCSVEVMRGLSRNLLFRQQVCKLCLIYSACTLTCTDYQSPSPRLYLKLFSYSFHRCMGAHVLASYSVPSFVTFLNLIICPLTLSWHWSWKRRDKLLSASQLEKFFIRNGYQSWTSEASIKHIYQHFKIKCVSALPKDVKYVSQSLSCVYLSNILLLRILSN
jgi:hypothetical protein